MFSKKIRSLLTSYGLTQPINELQTIDLVNARRSLKNLAKQFPGEFKKIFEGKAKIGEFFPSACAVFRFVYEVRCNLFHGMKTTVKLLDSGQQRRLLIYTAILITGNSLLFKVAENGNIGWKKVKVDFTLQPLESKHNLALSADAKH